jgi:pyridoxine 4-dehydrogenase
MTSFSSSPAAEAGTVKIGKDIVVHRLGFGAMRLTGAGVWGEPKNPALARQVLGRAVELGVQFIDTADSYGPDVSERIITEALYPYSPKVVIATKGGLTRPGPNQWERNGRPEYLRTACEGSLRRLRLERIDLYQLHAPDARVPLEDSLGALVELQKEGKIRHIGVSNFSVQELRRAQAVARIVSVQNRYNATDREHDDVVDFCERDGLVFIPWYPLAAGEHTQSRHSQSASGSVLDRIAKRHGVTLAQASLAWLLARSPNMLPIPGTSSLEHLEENVAAASIKLAPEELG